MPLSPLLSVEHVVKRFGGNVAVDRLSFVVHPGEIVGLVGPNGAGKTTMFDCLAGSHTPTAGSIRLGDRTIHGLPAHARVALGLGRTFQIPRPFGTMSVVENVMMGAQGQRGEALVPNWLTPGRVARQEREIRARARAGAARVRDFGASRGRTGPRAVGRPNASSSNLPVF